VKGLVELFHLSKCTHVYLRIAVQIFMKFVGTGEFIKIVELLEFSVRWAGYFSSHLVKTYLYSWLYPNYNLLGICGNTVCFRLKFRSEMEPAFYERLIFCVFYIIQGKEKQCN